VLAAFAWVLPRAFEETRAEEGTTITLTIPGAAGGQWSVARKSTGWQLPVGAPNLPTADQRR
jgi:hypothetical protein